VRVLILGGYGVFGGRLARLLADVAELEMLICGRDAARARAFCGAFDGAARVRPLRVDRAEIASVLEAERPDILVDASGPFQAYGDTPHGVVEACIAAGIDYLDFADAADFVFAISRHDAAARAAGVTVLSGVSSFPVLTAAVLRAAAREMEITAAAGGIAPSPHAGIGLNVMRAVVGYAGAPVALRRDGAPATGRGLVETMRYTIAVPGRVPLRNKRFSLVEVPDLQVIPPEHPSLRDIWMGAGPVPEVLHRMLNLLARGRAAGWLPSLVPLAPLFYRVLNLMRFGEHRGGMFVEVRGRRDGAEVIRSWHLLAEGDDGPLIPSMAIEALIRKRLAGDRPEPGARPATHALELADYDRLFAGRAIVTGWRETLPVDAPLYRHVLGPALDTLPQPVRALHDATGARRWSGRAEVRRGKGLPARILVRLFGFPTAGRDVPVTVEFRPEGGGEAGAELWTRRFGDRAFSSLQWRGTGRNAHLLMERFGPFTVALALEVDGPRLRLIPRSWFLLGLPLPRALMPGGDSFETEGADGAFRFDVEIRVPLIGRVVAYRGDLRPE